MNLEPMIDIGGGQQVRQFIMAPGPVKDGTLRCISCGQLDEDGYHDAGICRRRHAAHRNALAIADHVTGGRPERCSGHKAKRWEAAYEAAFLTLTAQDHGKPQPFKGETVSIEVSFPAAVRISNNQQRRLVELIGEICDDYEDHHPDRVMWPFGIGDKLTVHPMMLSDDEPMPFDSSIFHVECSERERFEGEER